MLDRQLRASVGTDGREGHVLGDRHRAGLAIERTRRRKHNRYVSRQAGSIQKVQRSDNIVVVVLGRILDRLTDIRAGGEMQGNDRTMFGERPRQPALVEEVAFNERSPANEAAIAGRQIVVHHRLEAAGGKGRACMAADVPRSSDDKDPRACCRNVHLESFSPTTNGEHLPCVGGATGWPALLCAYSQQAARCARSYLARELSDHYPAKCPLAHLYHREPRLGENSPRLDRFSHVTR